MTGFEFIIALGIFQACKEFERNWKNKKTERQKRQMQEMSASTFYSESIVVLGMKDAGKTRLHCALQNVEYVCLETSIEEYSDYFYTKKNGDIVHIYGGVDIGGGNNFKSKYKDLINTADIVFYLLDFNKYTNEQRQEYHKEARARLQFITETCIANNKKMITFLTHADKFKKDDLEKALYDYKKEIIERGYGDAVRKYHYYAVNTEDREELRRIIDLVL